MHCKNAITVLKNTNTILPVKELENQNSVRENGRCHKRFFHFSTLRKYAEVTEISDGNLDNFTKLKEFTTVLLGTINLTLLLRIMNSHLRSYQGWHFVKKQCNSRCFLRRRILCPLLILRI
jgi:hypothetical protein